MSQKAPLIVTRLSQSISPISQQSQIALDAPEDADIPPRLQSQRSITLDVHRAPAPPPILRQSLALDGIPVEIFEEIITYLSVKDLCNLAQVCSTPFSTYLLSHFFSVQVCYVDGSMAIMFGTALQRISRTQGRCHILSTSPH